MKAATPPRRCAPAMTCWQSVVLPDDSGPNTSVTRPRGMPPTPSARSRAIEPVGMKSTCCRSAEPSFMIDPRPNCFSIARIAASTAFVRSAADAPVRSVIAISSCSCLVRSAPTERTMTRPSGCSALRLFLDHRARRAFRLDELDVLRHFEERLELWLRLRSLGPVSYTHLRAHETVLDL